jgi:hypothetical protein
VIVPTLALSRKTSYARTPMLSVAAVQFSVTVVPDAEPVSLVGAVGAWVSASQCGGVIGTVVLAWETLPAASRALT